MQLRNSLMNSESDRVLVLGAGPAGMACSYTLAKRGQSSFVIEKDKNVGGLCQTIDFNGYLFDIGGHRFLSNSDEVNELWHEIMGNDLLKVKRVSRIYYKNRFFKYPLSLFDTFGKLGALESFRCGASYLNARFNKNGNGNGDSFEGWIIDRFGKRLYEIFFNTYTQKVWAMPCKDISADWAAQRIQGLSLRVAIKKAILGTMIKGPKTLCEEFLYPRKGPGEFYDDLRKRTTQSGTRFNLNMAVTALKHNGRKIKSIEVKNSHKLGIQEIPVDYIFSSLPLPFLITSLKPKPPKDILLAARRLRFRSFIVVNVIFNKKDLFPDQWVYVHSPEVMLGRIQNYKNWSPAMIADPQKTSLGLEYFCTEGDKMWKMNDADLIDFALGELEKLGIVSREYFIDGFVVRRSNVYPVYSLDYQKDVHIIRDYLNRFTNFQTIGRGGLFRYGNSDHAMLTGIYAAKNFLERKHYDSWNLGAEKEYLEARPVAYGLR